MSTVVPAPTQPAPERQRVGWLELFYDLVFVVVVAQLAARLHGELSAIALWSNFGLLIIVWSAWFNCVSLTNVNHGVAAGERIYVLASMAGVAVMAVGLSPQHNRMATFAIGYAIARASLSPLWVKNASMTGQSLVRPLIFGPGLALGWAASAWLSGTAQVWVWVGLMVLDTSLSVLRPQPGQSLRFDTGHLLERIGLFVLITFGESVALLSESLDAEPGAETWLVAGLSFVLLCGLFWMFYDMALERMERALEATPERLGDVLGAGQFMVIGGLIGLAAGLRGVVEAAAQHESVARDSLMLVAGGEALVLLGITSLTMDAIRIGRGESATKRGARSASRSFGRSRLYMTLRCVALPWVVWRWGGDWSAWLVVAVLALTPLAVSITGWVGRWGRRELAVAGDS